MTLLTHYFNVQTLTGKTNSLQAIKNLENKDSNIISKIQEITNKDKNFWSSPANSTKKFSHKLLQYPAMMVLAVQKKILEIIVEEQKGVKTMFDPFMGSGTTLLAGIYCGLDCWGQDINPLAVLLSKVRTKQFQKSDLENSLKSISSSIKKDSSDLIAIDFPKRSKWFKDEISIELSKIVRAIKGLEDIWHRCFFWVALAETIRLTSNSRTSTVKLHIRDEKDLNERNLSAITVFTEIAEKNIKSVNEFKQEIFEKEFLNNDLYIGEVQASLLDSSEKINLPGEEAQFDILLSSPPYGDNHTTITYGQFAYLPLQWINLTDIDASLDSSWLRTTQEIDRKSLGGRRPGLTEEQKTNLKLQSKSLSGILDQLLTASTKDRHSKVLHFYDDFTKVLDKVVPAMKKNAYLVWTVGNRRVGNIEIPNDKILQELMEYRDVSYVHEFEREILNKRMPSKNNSVSTMKREIILIFRKN